MTTKQRAYLKGLAMTMDSIFQVGKASMNPGLTEAIAEALEARELIKISVLKNCMDDPREIAETLAERTQSLCVEDFHSVKTRSHQVQNLHKQTHQEEDDRYESAQMYHP